MDNSVCAFFAHAVNDWKEYNAKYYNKAVVISVGYRVNLKRVQSFTNVQKMHIGNLDKLEEL